MRKFSDFEVKLPAKASIWYLASGIIGKGLGVLTTPFFTRLLSGEEYGEFTLYITLAGIASVSCSAISSGSAVYDGMKAFEDKKGSYLKSALTVSLLFSLLFCLLLFAFSPFFDFSPLLFLPLTAQILCDATLSVFMCSRRFYYRYKEITAINIISAALPPSISIFLLYTVGGGYRARIYVLLFTSLALAVYALIRLLCERGAVVGKMALYLTKKAMPLIPHGIGSAVCAQADKLIITAVMGAEALAKYSVVHSLGLAIQFITTALGSALWPWLIRRLNAGEKERITELFIPLLYGLSALNLCVVAAAPEAMAILAPRVYMQAFSAMLPISLSALISFFCSFATVTLVHLERGRAVATASLAGTVSCVLLNFMLITPFGYLGAGLSLLLSQLLTAAIDIEALRKAGVSDLLPVPKLCRAFLLSAGLGLAFFLCSELLFLRVLLLIAPAVILLNCLFSAKELIVEKTA